MSANNFEENSVKMSLTKEDSSDLMPTAFVRGSKFRKSFRIRQRYNSKLPPAAILFMKSMEKNKVNTSFETVKGKSIFYTTAVEVEMPDESMCVCNEDYDSVVEDDEQKLIKKSPVLRHRSSIKKLSGKKKMKMSKLISFFRK